MTPQVSLARSLLSDATLILASASPRRQELLRNAGIVHVVCAAQIDETPRANEDPRAYAERLAREKASAVFRLHPLNFVLGADTIVIVDGEILGKPSDNDEATRMLQLLSGRTHQVITGVCLVGPERSAEKPRTESKELRTGFEDTRSETTLVTMTELSDKEIHDYIASGEPSDKAGAYGIQGRASRWITRIEGDYFNVVGLPVALVNRILREHGVL